MKIGFMGLGKLGLPCALAVERAGHEVMGCDKSPNVAYSVYNRHYMYEEEHAQELLRNSAIELRDAKTLADWSDIVFVAVQTPHEPAYEGITPMPDERSDFDYGPLKAAIAELVVVAVKPLKLVIISTVLPGTVRREVLPLVPASWSVCYNPFFIAMGTVIYDFTNPEFVLVGSDGDPGWLKSFYSTLHDRPILTMSIESAELTKVAYNTFIGMKITFANAIMEICHKVRADCDDVSNAIRHATDRLISGRYLTGGMGDGGGCFPAGELVMTSTGPRSIDTIEPGDLVLTIDGTYAPVMKRWERQYDGELIVVQTEGMPPVRETVEHPLYVRRDLRRVQKNGRRCSSKPIASCLGELTPVEAAELTARSDFAAWPVLAGDVPRPEHVTDLYCHFAGWYLAEGNLDVKYGPQSMRSGRVQFSLHSNEISVAERLALCMQQYDPPKPLGAKGGGAKSTVTSCGPNSISLRRGSKLIAELLMADFGCGHREKRLPDWVLRGDARTQALVLHGMINGDGGSYCKRIEFNTTSSNLAFGVMMVLDRLDCAGNLRLVKARGHKTKGGFANSGDYYVVRIGSSENVNRLEQLLEIPSQGRNARYPLVRSPIVSGHRMRRIHKLYNESYTGTVYNLWVDHPTHTFVTAAGAQANCHPRDGIAMSWLARRLDLSHDIFADVMRAREDQTKWLAELVRDEVASTGLPAIVLGKAFKPGTKLVTGSPALLLTHYLREMGVEHAAYDPHVDGIEPPHGPAVYFVATAHQEFLHKEFPAGSTVIDPHGLMPARPGVKLLAIGRNRR